MGPLVPSKPLMPEPSPTPTLACCVDSLTSLLSMREAGALSQPVSTVLLGLWCWRAQAAAYVSGGGWS